MRCVVDASVAIKWLLPERDDEDDSQIALELLDAVKSNRIELSQPPHWLAEVAAVVTRLSPATALEDIADLHMMKIKVVESVEIYRVACELSIDLDHHLFDTLYHAVANSIEGAVLVTADERYYKKAAKRGHLVMLNEFA